MLDPSSFILLAGSSSNSYSRLISDVMPAREWVWTFSQEDREETDEFRAGNYLPELEESRIFLEGKVYRSIERDS